MGGLQIPLEHVLLLAATLFSCGLLGLMLRRNIIYFSKVSKENCHVEFARIPRYSNDFYVGFMQSSQSFTDRNRLSTTTF